ncbi:MAG: FHA domain-containing protein [Ktedonobacteraceae bacterium]|nr:FHA domain-containing protein [Ktedonobacteraceae bacterium]
MAAITANALYTTLSKRGTTRQLAGVIITCVASALLLLPALGWYTLRFNADREMISQIEVQGVLVYIALCGWLLPLGTTTVYCLYALPRNSTTALRMPRSLRKPRTQAPEGALPQLHPPRVQPGVPVPLVFEDEAPWGWLEYGSGSFMGQRLALKHMVVTLGRDEDCDIWLDDEMASRHHAELACDQKYAYLTDYNSLNGTLVNGRRIIATVLLNSNDIIEIGTSRFLFHRAERKARPSEEDPLAHHSWHSWPGLQEDQQDQDGQNNQNTQDAQSAQDAAGKKPVTSLSDAVGHDARQSPSSSSLRGPAEANPATPLPPSLSYSSRLVIRDGALAGQSFALNRPQLIIGRGAECDIVLQDASVLQQHTQIICQLDGDYVQDLNGQGRVTINGQPLRQRYHLRTGDVLGIGNISLEYLFIRALPVTPAPSAPLTQSWSGLRSGPVPLRLPSKPKKD